MISETLNCCEAETVEQMHQAMQSIFEQHSRAFRHDYRVKCLVLDVDTGYQRDASGQAGRKSDQRLFSRHQEQTWSHLCCRYDNLTFLDWSQ